MKQFADMFGSLFLITSWVFGIAVAKGFWMTVGAICLPPMAFVLLAQWILDRFA